MWMRDPLPLLFPGWILGRCKQDWFCNVWSLKSTSSHHQIRCFLFLRPSRTSPNKLGSNAATDTELLLSTSSHVDWSRVLLWYSIALASSLTDSPSHYNVFISQSIGPCLIGKAPAQWSAADVPTLWSWNGSLIKKHSYTGLGTSLTLCLGAWHLQYVLESIQL